MGVKEENFLQDCNLDIHQAGKMQFRAVSVTCVAVVGPRT